MTNLIHEASHFETMNFENTKDENMYHVAMFTTTKEDMENMIVPIGNNPDGVYDAAKEAGIIIKAVQFAVPKFEQWCMLSFEENNTTIVYGFPLSFLEKKAKELNMTELEVYAQATNNNPSLAKELYQEATEASVIYAEYTVPYVA